MKNGEILGQQIIKKKNLFSSFVGRCKVVDEYADNGKQSSKVRRQKTEEKVSTVSPLSTASR
jgi:hypothetical protein